MLQQLLSLFFYCATGSKTYGLRQQAFGYPRPVDGGCKTKDELQIHFGKRRLTD